MALPLNAVCGDADGSEQPGAMLRVPWRYEGSRQADVPNLHTPTLTRPEPVWKSAFSPENMFPAWYQAGTIVQNSE